MTKFSILKENLEKLDFKGKTVIIDLLIQTMTAEEKEKLSDYINDRL